MLDLTLKRNKNLIETATDAIVSSGCTIYRTQGVKPPFRLQVQINNELLDVNIYLWELTPQSKNQYEIQMLGVNHLKLLDGGKTLILGWWKETEVFAGFDVRKHFGKLGDSPSIQIQKDVLRKAYINGFEPSDKGNKEAAIAFRPDFFDEYLKNLESLHDFGQSAKDLAILSEVAKNPEVNEADIQLKNVARKMTLGSLRKKLRAASFRNRVLTSYRSRCAFCSTFDHVEAAHIIPVNHEMSTDETRNGLALCALHHKAYDHALVTVNTDYSIQVNRFKAEELQIQRLADGLAKFSQDLRPLIVLPPAVSDRPHIEYIQIANDIRGWRR